MARWKLINDTLNLGHPEPLETYSTSEHLLSALGIPAAAKGSLPVASRGRAGLEAEDLEDIGETGKNRTRRQTAGSRTPRDERGSGHRQGEGNKGGHPSGGRNRTRRRTRGGAPVRTPAADHTAAAQITRALTTARTTPPPPTRPQQPVSRRRGITSSQASQPIAASGRGGGPGEAVASPRASTPRASTPRTCTRRTSAPRTGSHAPLGRPARRSSGTSRPARASQIARKGLKFA